MSENLVDSFTAEFKAETIKQIAGRAAIWIIAGIGFILVGSKSVVDLFGQQNSMIDVYARLNGVVAPGETVELYPPSDPKIVSNNGEVKWRIPFSAVASKNIQIQKVYSSKGKRKTEILVQHKLEEAPIILFVMER